MLYRRRGYSNRIIALIVSAGLLMAGSGVCPAAGEQGYGAVSAVSEDRVCRDTGNGTPDAASDCDSGNGTVGAASVCDSGNGTSDAASDCDSGKGTSEAASAFDTGETDQPSVLKGLTAGYDYSADSVAARADSYDEALDIASAYGMELESYDHGIASFTVSDNATSDEVLLRCESDKELPDIYPNLYSRIFVHDDPYLSNDSECYQWQHGEDFLNTGSAWELSKGKGITVAVIDTGVTDCEEFGSRLLEGVNTLDRDYTTKSTDDLGHGTHVAGIIGASLDNGKGGAGVAPEVKILPIRAFRYDPYSGTYISDSTNLSRAVYVAIESGVDIINFSGGGYAVSDLEKKAWKDAVDAGIVVVAAAGNSSTDTFEYPSAYKDVISVAALDRDGTLADYSNFGSTVDISAPGTDIWSTIPESCSYFNQYKGKGKAKDGHVCLSGTSMATPVVTGVVALMLAANPGLKNGKKTAGTIKSLLCSSINDISYYREYSAGHSAGVSRESAGVYGSVNALKAVSAAISGSKPEKPVITVKDAAGGYRVELDCSTTGAEIYYTMDGSKPSALNGELYTGAFLAPLGGIRTIKAIAMLGREKSKIAALKYDFDVAPESVIINGGRDIYIMAGGSAVAKADFVPAFATKTELTYSVTGEGFSVDEKGIISCAPGTKEGARAVLKAVGEGGISAQTELVAKSSGCGIIAVPDMLSLVAVENENTRAAGYSISCDLLPEIKSNMPDTDYVITSSKPSVVRVVNNRYLVACSKGKATVTVTANDGSGCKDKCKVNVLMPVFDISAIKTSTGFLNYGSTAAKGTAQTGDPESGLLTDIYAGTDTLTDRSIEYVPIARGGKIKLTGYFNYDYRWKSKAAPAKRTIPSNRKTDYYVSGNGATYVSIKNGLLTCRNNASVGKVFTVTMKAADGFGAQRTIRFRIYDHPGEAAFSDKSYAFRKGATLAEKSFVLNGKTVVGMLDRYLRISDSSCGIYSVKADRRMVSRYLTKYTDQSSGEIVYAHYYGLSVPGKTAIDYRTRDGSNIRFTLNLEVLE